MESLGRIGGVKDGCGAGSGRAAAWQFAAREKGEAREEEEVEIERGDVLTTGMETGVGRGVGMGIGQELDGWRIAGWRIEGLRVAGWKFEGGWRMSDGVRGRAGGAALWRKEKGGEVRWRKFWGEEAWAPAMVGNRKVRGAACRASVHSTQGSVHVDLSSLPFVDMPNHHFA